MFQTLGIMLWSDAPNSPIMLLENAHHSQNYATLANNVNL